MRMKELDPILVIDDEPETLRMLLEVLSDEGYAARGTTQGTEALEWIQRQEFAVVLVDLIMSPVRGERIIETVKAANPLTEVIVVTAHASLESTLEAIRYHVFDYLEKPFDLDRLIRTVKNALEQYQLARENERIISRLNRQHEILRERIQDVSRELKQLATVDALTGLHNYRYFSEVIQTEVSRAIRYGRPVTLAMLDLDYFKHYNDDYGHVQGNEALRRIAERMRATLREVDILFRYGGEEFAILLPETPKGRARTNIARVCRRVRDLDLAVRSPEGPKTITLSCGLAACPEDAQDAKALNEAADLALYRAKSMGRNQIVFYTPALREG